MWRAFYDYDFLTWYRLWCIEVPTCICTTTYLHVTVQPKLNISSVLLLLNKTPSKFQGERGLKMLQVGIAGKRNYLHFSWALSARTYITLVHVCTYGLSIYKFLSFFGLCSFLFFCSLAGFLEGIPPTLECSCRHEPIH